MINERKQIIPVLIRLFYFSKDRNLNEMSLDLLLKCFN